MTPRTKRLFYFGLTASLLATACADGRRVDSKAPTTANLGLIIDTHARRRAASCSA